MFFITETGSKYEIDKENSKIRRLNGKNSPTNRQGEDGEWKKYFNISGVEIGKSVVILWEAKVELLAGSPKAAIPATTTSLVVEIEE